MMDRILKREKPIAVVKTFAVAGNLGPGYDVLGLALDIFNTYSVFYSNDKKVKPFLFKEDDIDLIIKAPLCGKASLDDYARGFGR